MFRGERIEHGPATNCHLRRIGAHNKMIAERRNDWRFKSQLRHPRCAEVYFAAFFKHANTREHFSRANVHAYPLARANSSRRIRQHSQAAGEVVKQQGRPNDLLERLRSDPKFAGVKWEQAMDASRYVGRAPQQVEAFVRAVVEPIRERYRSDLGQRVQLRV